MRWKIETKKEVNKKKTSETNLEIEKKTILTRKQYITIGDIVGMGKSAAGAVQKLSKTLPAFINNFNTDPKGKATAIAVNSMLKPFLTIMTGMDIYKKVMGVIDTLTPIMKLVARATGVWCSPGNASDMAQIALGAGQKLLITIATSALLKLKEMIWNYEFQIRELSVETSIIINAKLEKYNKENQGIVLEDDPFGEDFYSSDALKDIDKEIDNMFEKPSKETVDPEGIVLSLKGEDPTENSKCKRRTNYITELAVGALSEYKRILSGSINNKGIYFSDNNGFSFEETKMRFGSFITFEKVLVNGQYIYVAGSIDEIISVKPTIDKTPEASKDANGQYNKDYYNKNLRKYSKFNKDNILKENNYSLLNDKDEYNKGIGIYYSEDDGLNWKVSDLRSGQFNLIKNFNDILVASSYDYKGLYYSNNGKNWINSNLNNKPITTGRWTSLNSLKETPNRITVSYIRNINDFNIGRISTIEDAISSTNYIQVSMDINSYQGKGFENYDKYKDLINEIIIYLHTNYKDLIKDKTNIDWENLINEIINDRYTLEDAQKGKDF